MTIFERTKEIAGTRGMSLAEVSRKAGLSDKAIYRWQSASPRMETIQKVADVLGVSIDYLLGNTDEKNPTQGDNSNGDLKEFFKENPALSFDGKEIPQEDLKIIKRILESMDGD